MPLQSTRLQILYEDSHLIALNKEPGTIVIPGRGVSDSDTLVRRLEDYCGGKIFVVHRLDRETSGVVLFARDASTHRELNLQFEKREINKVYLAVAEGMMDGEGVIDKPLYQFGSGRMGVDSRGKESLTCYRVLCNLRNSTLLEVRPQTGRKHQIRVHLYSIGHPVLGDRLYGYYRPVGGIPRLMLHAYRITFTLSGNRRTIEAPPDQEWERIISQLG